MAKILAEYDTNTKKLMVKHGDDEKTSLNGLSFYLKGKNDDGEDEYGCEMSMYTKDKENDTYHMERMMACEQP